MIYYGEMRVVSTQKYSRAKTKQTHYSAHSKTDFVNNVKKLKDN